MTSSIDAPSTSRISTGFETWADDILERHLETLLLSEPARGVLCVAFNRPAVANAFCTQSAREFHDVFAPMRIAKTRFRCVVLTGSGDKAFCAGGDLKERLQLDSRDWVLQHELIERAVRALVDCPLPVIAAVNGAAYGGGLEMMLQCDFAYAASHARFALTETSLGIMPGTGGTQTLPRAVGERRAKELILAAQAFSAQEAFEWGLVNKVCAPQALMAETLSIATRIASNAPLAVRQAKHVIHHGLHQDLATAMLFEVEAYQRMVGTRDRIEGIAAFNEKRQPQFRDE